MKPSMLVMGNITWTSTGIELDGITRVGVQVATSRRLNAIERDKIRRDFIESIEASGLSPTEMMSLYDTIQIESKKEIWTHIYTVRCELVSTATTDQLYEHLSNHYEWKVSDTPDLVKVKIWGHAY